MCHLSGIILGRKMRRVAEREMLVSILRDVLVASGPLGPHATGAGWVKRSGEFAIYKDAVTAEKLVSMPEFDELVSSVDNTTTVLLGHARYRTRGDERNNANNHPLVANSVVGTVRGTLLNADELFPKFRLKRTAQVDSELLVRLAAVTGRLGPIDTRRFLAGVRYCRGQISGILVSLQDPETILVLKGDTPLEFRYHKTARAVAYASKGSILDSVLVGADGWRVLEVPAMSLAVFRTDAIQDVELLPLEYHVQRPRSQGNQRVDPGDCDTATPPWHWSNVPGSTQTGPAPDHSTRTTNRQERQNPRGNTQ